MDTNTVFLVILVVIGLAIGTVGFDRFLHNRERPNFAAGVMMTAFAACGVLLLITGHNNFNHKATSLMFFAFILIGLAGNLLIDKNNIDDQESGRMSKWGTWWDRGNDNYIANIVDKWETWGLICIIGLVMFNVAFSKETKEVTAAQASPAPVAPAPKTHNANKNSSHKALKVSRAHQTKCVRTQTFHSNNHAQTINKQKHIQQNY
jgi:hypothetical protein